MAQYITKISPYLYLGPAINKVIDYTNDNNSKQNEIVAYLKHMGVSTIVNCDQTLVDVPVVGDNDDLTWIHYPITPNTNRSFVISAESHITQLINGRTRVYVQCSTGDVLAPILVLMFLMKTWNMKYERATSFIKDYRSTTKFNHKFIQQQLLSC